MLRVSVSSLDLFRSYRDDSEDRWTLESFMAQLRGQTARTPGMERGSAFAKAMEHAQLGECSTISAEGHTFAFTCDAEIESWPCREEKREKDYGGVIVSARCDRIMGRVVVDDKTTEKWDSESVEKYMDRYQWRMYLDMYDADVFKWHIWLCRGLSDPCEWEVHAHHLLTQCRYPKMADDCRELALEFKEFSEQVGWKGSVPHDR
jgi:hypothetical protein